MKITYKNITLRDYQYSDIDDEIRWTNEDVDWFYESSPCSSLERVDPDELRAEMTEFIENFPDYPIRWKFEIDFEGKHIGTLSSYYLDNNFEYTPWESIDQNKNAAENNSIRAIGIEICEKSYWSKGIGANALTAFINYYRNFGEKEFLLETWSGNKRMLRCAEKLGFEVIKRIENDDSENNFEDLILKKCY